MDGEFSMPLSQIDRIFQRDPVAFLKQYAITPLDFTSVSARLLATGLYDAKTHNQAGGAGIDSTLSVKGRSKQIAYTTLEQVSDPQTNQTEHNSYKLMFRCPTEVGTDSADYIPCWFLPWASNHLTRMVIPPRIANRALDSDIFFTAAINGCSVMVTGNPKGPTITHGGTQDSRSNPSNENPFANSDARQHWLGLFQADLATRNVNTPIYGIHKDDYINHNLTGTTPEATAYQNFLGTNSSQTMRVEDVRAEGAVFGVRDAGGDWSFYLQKKARITFTRLRKVKRTFGSSQYKDIQVVTGRTVPVYKGGKKVADVPEVILDKRTVNVTISVVKFFPGGGNAGGGGVALPNVQVKALLDSYNI
jgi:hypothetical protein